MERNLDIYPNPSYHLIDPFSYKRKFNGEQAITILTSRGCPFRCSFCGLPEQHKIMRYRTPENVTEEIKSIQKKYGINKFNFQDDTFTVKKSRLHNMLELFEPLEIGFRAHGRSGLDKPEDYIRLGKAGCDTLAWGIESGSQKILDVIQKDVTIKKQEAGLKAAHDAGLKVRAQFMIGLPQETEEDFKQNLAFIEHNNKYVDKWGIHIFVPFPSCEIWENPEKFKYNIDKNTDFSDFQTIGKPGEWNFVPKENQKQIAEWRDKILALIGEKNIYRENGNEKN